MTAYIDTSVLVAYYCPEPLSAKAETALKRLNPPVLSPLVDAELHSALALKTRTGECEVSAARAVSALFRRHVRDGYYRFVPVEAKDFEQARDWLARFSTPLRTLDALHLAIAQDHGLTVLTADRGFAKVARALNVSARLLG